MSRRDAQIALGLAALTALYWATFVDIGIELTDEGKAAMSGARLLRGERPFADFFLFYFPGYPLWVAGSFLLFGESVLAARLGWLVFAIARTPLVYAVARRLAPPGPALALASVALLIPGPSWKLQVSTLFLLGLLAALRYGERPGPGRAALAGAAAGFAIWFRWDAALATAAATAVVAVGAQRGGRVSGRDLARDAAAFSLVFAAWLLPGVAWLAATPGALEGVAEHFSYHAKSLEAFALPWPSPLPGFADSPRDLPQALRRALYSLPLVGLVVLPLSRFGPRARRPLVLAVWGVALVAYGLAVRRPDPSHFVQILCVALLPLLALRPRARPARLAAACLIGLFAAGLLAEATRKGGARRPTPRLAFETLEAIDLPRARLRARPAEAREVEAVVAAIERRTEPGDPIAVFPVEVMVQFLADRPAALRYDALYPVLLEDPQRQARAAADLARAKLVLVRPMRHGFAGPGSPTPEQFAPLLWNALETRFRPAGRAGRFILYEPRAP